MAIALLWGLALLLTAGLFAGYIVERFRLPALLGMLAAGMALGPFGFNIVPADLLHVSHDLRSFALIVILVRAGLGLKRHELARVGGAALRLSIIPCLLEGVTVMAASYVGFGLSFAEAGMLGFIVAAVSPAVVVPAMIDLKQQRYGEAKHIPILIMAGASVDDVAAIALFTSFLRLGVGGPANVVTELAQVPLNIGMGILGGVVIGMVLVKAYGMPFLRNRRVEGVLLLLTTVTLYFALSERLGIAGLLGVMAAGMIVTEKRPTVARGLANTLAGLWVVLQIVLFTLVGTEVDIHVALQAGVIGAGVIVLGLVGRSVGVWLATMGTALNTKERIFCMIAYVPKATVQAAIGSLPFMWGVAAGPTILAVAVLSIIITAPLGAIGIKRAAPLLLEKAG